MNDGHGTRCCLTKHLVEIREQYGVLVANKMLVCQNVSCFYR